MNDSFDDEDIADRRRVAPKGRRTEDLVGWRLGQLENSLDSLERSVEEFKKDLYGRKAVKTENITERDWALRIILFLLTVLTTVTAIVQIFTAH
jgi:hypothetical protein